jgi:hypothetical protein
MPRKAGNKISLTTEMLRIQVTRDVMSCWGVSNYTWRIVASSFWEASSLWSGTYRTAWRRPSETQELFSSGSVVNIPNRLESSAKPLWELQICDWNLWVKQNNAKQKGTVLNSLGSFVDNARVKSLLLFFFLKRCSTIGLLVTILLPLTRSTCQFDDLFCAWTNHSTLVATRAVQSIHKSFDSDSFIKAQYVLITVNL